VKSDLSNNFSNIVTVSTTIYFRQIASIRKSSERMSGCKACIQGSRQAEKILYPISKEKEKERIAFKKPVEVCRCS
jgi:hypothetical protein